MSKETGSGQPLYRRPLEHRAIAEKPRRLSNVGSNQRRPRLTRSCAPLNYALHLAVG
jgi:hypothetical protein